MFSRSFKGVGLHYTAFRDAIREDSRQTTPSRGVTPRKKFAAQANVESRVNGATNARRFVLFVRKGSVDPTGIQGDTLSISLTDISDAEIDEAAFKEMKSEFRNHYHPMFEFC